MLRWVVLSLSFVSVIQRGKVLLIFLGCEFTWLLVVILTVTSDSATLQAGDIFILLWECDVFALSITSIFSFNSNRMDHAGIISRCLELKWEDVCLTGVVLLWDESVRHQWRDCEDFIFLILRALAFFIKFLVVESQVSRLPIHDLFFLRWESWTGHEIRPRFSELLAWAHHYSCSTLSFNVRIRDATLGRNQATLFVGCFTVRSPAGFTFPATLLLAISQESAWASDFVILSVFVLLCFRIVLRYFLIASLIFLVI